MQVTPTASPLATGLHAGAEAVTGTGAGEANGIDHNENWLRLLYVFICFRPHYLLHPYAARPTVPTTLCWPRGQGQPSRWKQACRTS
eukprot:COSAG01_NODE_26784_length_703_cov_1.316225_1_plen_86_part_01